MLSGISMSIFKVCRKICLFLLISMGLFLLLSISFRTLGYSISWTDEAIQLCTVWMVFIGSAVLLHDKEHISMELFSGKSSGKFEKLRQYLLGIFTALIALAFIIGGWQLFLEGIGQTSPTLRISRSVWYLAIPISGLLMLLAISKPYLMNEKSSALEDK